MPQPIYTRKVVGSSQKDLVLNMKMREGVKFLKRKIIRKRPENFQAVAKINRKISKRTCCSHVLY